MRKGFTIHHNGPPARCIGQPHERCHRFWRGVRSFHMNDQGWSDIAYSFGVCPHGERFVGRGWDKRQFANGTDEVGVDNGPDSEWYSVLAFVGGDLSTRDEEVPTVSMIEGLAALIDEGREDGHCDSQVKPHKDWKRKPCPGTLLTAFARTWDGKPFPEVAPPAPIKLPEEDPMFLYSTAGKPVMFCHAGVSVGLNEATDLPTMAANQLPHLRLDDDTFDAFLRSYPRAS